MLKEIKKSTVKKLLKRRSENSHKGQNGRLLIVSGSIDYYGASVLAALGALYSGVDLIYLYVPECNFDVVRSTYPDFIVKKYSGEFLRERDTDEIIEFGKKCDAILIGPGLGSKESTIEAVLEIINKLHLPTVLDADAMNVIKKIEKFPLNQQIVITPHKNEFQNLTDRDINVQEGDPKSVILLRSISMDLHIGVLLKGTVDYISSEEGFVEKNTTGNAGMTVAGSGDVLAGLLGSLLAQGMDTYDASRCAAYIAGSAGDLLYKQKGYCYSASDIAFALPYAIKAI